ncbi:MAG: FliM/FliN family flagellar motor switch protein [Archangium sp.]
MPRSNRNDMTVTSTLSATIPSPAQLPPVPASRVRLSPLQKLTRAHFAASLRPAAIESMKSATSRIAQKLGAQLKTSLVADAKLQPSTLHPFSHLAGHALFVLLECAGEGIACVEFDLMAAGALLHRIAGARDTMGPPQKLTSIEEAALGWVVLSALAELRGEAALTTFAPRLLSVTMDRGEVLRTLDARRRHLAIQVDLQLGETRCGARVLAPALWVQSKLDALPEETPASLHEAVAAATLPATILIGSSLLPPGEAGSLTIGDVVFIGGVERQSFGLSGPGRIVTPSFELRGSFHETGFHLMCALSRPTQESSMSQIDPAVPVEVEIELTRLRLPLHQLGTLKTGAVVPLHINAAQHVLIRIGDKAVAKAELVEIEGEIGARIVAML